MTINWYYVENNDRVGPVDNEQLKNIIQEKKLDGDSYVWRKGFDNWQYIKNVEELAALLQENISTDTHDLPDFEQEQKSEQTQISAQDEDNFEIENQRDEPTDVFSTKTPFDWSIVSFEERIISIKTGIDRNTEETVYGPFSLEMIKRLFEQKRISEKTLIFTPGLENWMFLADIPIYGELFSQTPPIIEEADRRKATRRPFIARMLFHDNAQVFEGICRDISTGGLQVLVAGFPAVLGESITMNVHPDNSDYSFVAEGKIVRLLGNGQGFSLVFTKLGEEATKTISSYMA